MKKHLLPLSCLFLASACQHLGKMPDQRPVEDIPAGTYVRVTLQDVHKPQRRSTYVVDPRTNTVMERLDGKRAFAEQDAQALDSESTAMATKTPASSTRTVIIVMSAICRETQVAEDGCVDLAIDPKHETSGDPNPIKEEKRRIAITEQYVKQLAVNVVQTARRAGVRVEVPAKTLMAQ